MSGRKSGRFTGNHAAREPEAGTMNSRIASGSQPGTRVEVHTSGTTRRPDVVESSDFLNLDAAHDIDVIRRESNKKDKRLIRRDIEDQLRVANDRLAKFDHSDTSGDLSTVRSLQQRVYEGERKGNNGATPMPGEGSINLVYETTLAGLRVRAAAGKLTDPYQREDKLSKQMNKTLVGELMAQIDDRRSGRGKPLGTSMSVQSALHQSSRTLSEKRLEDLRPLKQGRENENESIDPG